MSKPLWGFFVFLLAGAALQAGGFPKSYYTIKDVETRKERFVSILLPVVESENRKILQERRLIIDFFSHDFFVQYNAKMKPANLARIVALAEKYKVPRLFDKEAYLERIDIIPPSLALSQAALESAWARSQYARRINNLYGHYSYDKRVKGRPVKGRRSRIREFDDLSGAVGAYMHNLNSHWAYEGFRAARTEARGDGRVYDGVSASKHLIRYSIMRKRYIKRVNRVIRDNHFLLYDTVFTADAVEFETPETEPFKRVTPVQAQAARQGEPTPFSYITLDTLENDAALPAFAPAYAVD